MPKNIAELESQLYELNQKINDLLSKVAQRHDLKIEIESDYHYQSVERNGYILELWVHHTLSKKAIKKIQGDYYQMTSNCKSFKYPLIQSPQIRQILNALKDVLGGVNIGIKKLGDGFIAYHIDDPVYIFQVYQDPFTSQKRREFVQTNYFNIKPYSRMWENKKDLEIELQKYYLDSENKESAVSLCSRWLDSLTPLIDTNPETVLSELLDVLNQLLD